MTRLSTDGADIAKRLKNVSIKCRVRDTFTLAATPHNLDLVQTDYGTYTGLVWSQYYPGNQLVRKTGTIVSETR